ncbi:hypothetical protein K8R62_03115 [bacterium]|nr:hypothetical protein [bacterium]
MIIKKSIKILSIIFVMFLMTACSVSFGGNTNNENDGGVFLSLNNGDTWKQRVLVPSVSGNPESIARIAVKRLAIDPNDNRAIYLGSSGNGLYYSYNVDKGWTFAEGLPKGTVNAVTVDPNLKCIIYTSIGNDVYKSTDCNRTWAPIYHDDEGDVTIGSITIDHYNTQIVYIGNSRGDIIKSKDGGSSWRVVHRLESAILNIKLSPFDSRAIYVSTLKDGVSQSVDGGMSWVDFKERLNEFKNSDKVRDLALCNDKDGFVYVATSYGLLKSEDRGETWAQINLITPEKETTINAMVINPKKCEEIYYVTENTFYRSFDGGENWATIELPTDRPGTSLLVDFEEPNILYLGVGAEKKNSRY